MHDDDSAQTKIDHEEKISRLLRSIPEARLVTSFQRTGELIAERDALREYARALERAVQEANDGVLLERVVDPALVIERMRAEHGVAALLENDPT